MIIFFLFILETARSSGNLIKMGDFQVYASLPSTTFNYTSYGYLILQSFRNIPSNVSGWYDNHMGPIQIKEHLSAITTSGVELSSSVPMTLCQDVILAPGSQYALSFDIYTHLVTQKLTAKAYLNGILLTELYVPINCTFKTKRFLFYANESFNALCFNEIHSPAPPFPYYPYFGGLIDNISLYLVEKQCIEFQYIFNQLTQSLILMGNSTYDEGWATYIQNRYDLFIGDQRISYKIQTSDTQKIMIEIQQKYSYNLDNVRFAKKQGYNQTCVVQLILSPAKKKYFLYLKQNQVQVLTKSKDILFFVNQCFSKITGISQIFLFSYFLNMIIDIQFLCLFYVFTQISLIPDFTRKIYYDVLDIVFSAKSLIQYVEDFFNIHLKQFSPKFQDQFPERLNQENNKEPWLGSYRLSSKVLKSNMNSILILILSLIKLGLLKLVFRFLGIFSSFFQKVDINVFSQILAQFCFLVPIILIPIQANLIEATIDFSQRGYKSGCFLFSFVLLMLLFLYIFLPSFIKNKIKLKPISKKKKKQIKQNIKIVKQENKGQINLDMKIKEVEKEKAKMRLKRKKKKNRRMRIFYNDEAFSMLLIYLIPFMSLIGNSKLFLAVNTIPVLLRFLSFLRYNHQNELLIQRIIDFSIGLIWLIHHTIFVTLFFFEQKNNLNSTEKKSIIYFGIGAVLTLLSIIILQILKFIIFIIIFFRTCYRFISPQKNKQQHITKSQHPRQQNKQVIQIQVIKNQITQKTKYPKKKIINVKAEKQFDQKLNNQIIRKNKLRKQLKQNHLINVVQI